MYKELFVTYNQALMLKNIGFTEPCLFNYDASKNFVPNATMTVANEGTSVVDFLESHNLLDDKRIDAPTLSHVQYWLRLNKNAIVYPYIFQYFENIDEINAKLAEAWTFELRINGEDRTADQYTYCKYETPEEAISGGITECLKILTYA